jgi:hypothetical protein
VFLDPNTPGFSTSPLLSCRAPWHYLVKKFYQEGETAHGLPPEAKAS